MSLLFPLEAARKDILQIQKCPHSYPLKICPVSVRVPLSLPDAEDEIGACVKLCFNKNIWCLFESFRFFYVTDAAVLERNHNFPWKILLDYIQFEKRIRDPFLPYWIRYFYISDNLSSHICIFGLFIKNTRTSGCKKPSRKVDKPRFRTVYRQRVPGKTFKTSGICSWN